MKNIPDNALGLYFSRMRENSLLSKAEEEELAYKIRRWRILESLIQRKKRGKLSDDEVKSLVKKIDFENAKREGEDAFEKMINSNLKLVINIAKRFIGKYHRLGFNDLIQEGNIGLILAIKRFNPRKGRLSTYATHWIRQTIMRAIETNAHEVSFPAHASVDQNNFRKTYKNLLLKMGRKPSQEDIAEEIKLTRTKDKNKLEKVKDLAIINERRFYALDAPLFDTSSKFSAFVEDTSVVGPHEICERESTKRRVSIMLNESLGDKELEIINLRFGLLKEQEEKSLDEIGKIFGITRERVRQIEKKALGKILKRYRGELCVLRARVDVS